MPPRYCPQRSFPVQAYVPGRTPHAQKPTRDAPAHEWDGDEESLLQVDDYLWAVDLFNQAFYWEAHEVWEELWKEAQPSSPARPFLQGLIQCAAASLKARGEKWPACQALADKALAKLAAVIDASGPRYQGLDLEDFVRYFRRYCEGTDSQTRAPQIVLSRD